MIFIGLFIVVVITPREKQILKKFFPNEEKLKKG